MRAERELVPLRSWWRGLDSNQRTLARADLQYAGQPQKSGISQQPCIICVSSDMSGQKRRLSSGRKSGVLFRVRDQVAIHVDCELNVLVPDPRLKPL